MNASSACTCRMCRGRESDFILYFRECSLIVLEVNPEQFSDIGLENLLDPICNCREAEKGSLVHLVNSIKNCNRLFADITSVAVECLQETDLMKTFER